MTVKEDQVHRDLQEFMETKGSREPPEYPGGPYTCTVYHNINEHTSLYIVLCVAKN